jgi:hypothetical protein
MSAPKIRTIKNPVYGLSVINPSRVWCLPSINHYMWEDYRLIEMYGNHNTYLFQHFSSLIFTVQLLVLVLVLSKVQNVVSLHTMQFIVQVFISCSNRLLLLVLVY